MDLTLNNQQRLIYHKTQTDNQPFKILITNKIVLLVCVKNLALFW